MEMDMEQVEGWPHPAAPGPGPAVPETGLEAAVEGGTGAAPEPAPSAPDPALRLRRLTRREAEVLRLLASGLSNAAIARRLARSPRTVSTHLTAIYEKLGVPSRSAAVRVALDHGLR